MSDPAHAGRIGIFEAGCVPLPLLRPDGPDRIQRGGAPRRQQSRDHGNDEQCQANATRRYI
jgi:hypothetical protein